MQLSFLKWKWHVITVLIFVKELVLSYPWGMQLSRSVFSFLICNRNNCGRCFTSPWLWEMNAEPRDQGRFTARFAYPAVALDQDWPGLLSSAHREASPPARAVGLPLALARHRVVTVTEARGLRRTGSAVLTVSALEILERWLFFDVCHFLFPSSDWHQWPRGFYEAIKTWENLGQLPL